MVDYYGHIPIYKRLTEFYRNKIIAQVYAPGARIDSINKIMDRHKVSRETAKLVLKKLMEEGLVVSKAGKGTFANSQAKTQKIWGVVVPFFSSNIEELIVKLNLEAQNYERSLKYFFHYNNADEEMRITGKLIQEGYEALIIVPNYNESNTANFYRKLISGKSKLILADNTMAGSYFNYVIQSYDLGVKRALEYLCNQNQGDLLLIGNEIWKGENLVFDLMENTFRMLIEEQYPDRKLHILSKMHQLSQQYISENNIGGILCTQDSDSIRIVGRLSKWGINIPKQVSVVSYGNTELTEFFKPGITSIDCNYTEMANSIAELINTSTKKINKQVVIQPKLIIRET